MKFGEFFEKLRLKNKVTLRGFCQKFDFDPGNISKIERGVFPAPQSQEKLEEYAKALGLKKGSDDWIKFFDLATASHKNFEVKNIKDEAILEKLPLLFRAIDRDDLSEDDLDQLIELIKKS